MELSAARLRLEGAWQRLEAAGDEVLSEPWAVQLKDALDRVMEAEAQARQ